MIFESVAYAMGSMPAGGEGGSNPITAFLPLILMFAIFYFLLIRPQQKKQKKHREFLMNLKKGDYVLTGGGMYGRIKAVEGDVLDVELAENFTVKINRSFISGSGDPTEAKQAAKSDKN